MKTEPQKEHEWLQQFVGEWTHKSECSMEPGMPPEKFEGSESATSGKGAVYAWEGNNDVGQGRMDIAASVPPFQGRDQARFREAVRSPHSVEFTLEPKEDVTNVTWAMQGNLPSFAKLVHVFLDMDSMVGKDFEAGTCQPEDRRRKVRETLNKCYEHAQLREAAGRVPRHIT